MKKYTVLSLALLFVALVSPSLFADEYLDRLNAHFVGTTWEGTFEHLIRPETLKVTVKIDSVNLSYDGGVYTATDESTVKGEVTLVSGSYVQTFPVIKVDLYDISSYQNREQTPEEAKWSVFFGNGIKEGEIRSVGRGIFKNWYNCALGEEFFGALSQK